MGKENQKSSRGVPRKASNPNRKRKYQTSRLVKQERCDERHVWNLVRHNGMVLEQAQAFWMRQKAAA